MKSCATFQIIKKTKNVETLSIQRIDEIGTFLFIFDCKFVEYFSFVREMEVEKVSFYAFHLFTFGSI